MSNRLFSTHNPVIHCAPKRVRRTWGRTLIDVLMLLALAALCGWLWSCVRHAAVSSFRFQVSSLPLAMAPVTQGMVYGLLLSLSVLGIVLAVRKVRQNELEAEQSWSIKHRTSNAEHRTLRLGLEDLREIVRACRVESREVLLLVEMMQRTVEQTQLDMGLEVAARKLTQLTKTLGHLHKSLRPMTNDECGMPKGMKCPHCESGLLWSEDRGAHCDGCDDFDPEKDLAQREDEA